MERDAQSYACSLAHAPHALPEASTQALAGSPLEQRAAGGVAHRQQRQQDVLGRDEGHGHAARLAQGSLKDLLGVAAAGGGWGQGAGAQCAGGCRAGQTCGRSFEHGASITAGEWVSQALPAAWQADGACHGQHPPEGQVLGRLAPALGDPGLHNSPCLLHLQAQGRQAAAQAEVSRQREPAGIQLQSSYRKGAQDVGTC